jgi:hypothetical protein
MLFMCIHTHSPEKCLFDKPEQANKFFTDFSAGAPGAGVKLINWYTAPQQHTMFVIFEADNLSALQKLLTPLIMWGTAQLIPVTARQIPDK